MNQETFLDMSEFMDRAIKQTAKRQGCAEDLVHSCMANLDTIWVTPNHLDAVREQTFALNDAARLARQLHGALSRMTKGQRDLLIEGGGVTINQVEHLARLMEGDAKGLRAWSGKWKRTGGRNPAAYAIAEMIRRIFRRQRRRITYGMEANSELPSTDFGRAVRDALGDFGVSAGWRGPARGAYEKHLAIGRRLIRIQDAKRERGRSA